MASKMPSLQRVRLRVFKHVVRMFVISIVNHNMNLRLDGRENELQDFLQVD
jgi:hypothetical protein